LLRAEKRFSQAFQILGSYTYSTNSGTNLRSGFNLDRWLENRGPLDLSDLMQIANLAGVVQLPWRFDRCQLFLLERTGVQRIRRVDRFQWRRYHGRPAARNNRECNRGIVRTDLERLVAQFNTTYAGAMAAQRTHTSFRNAAGSLCV
jgi:hypothetical protein